SALASAAARSKATAIVDAAQRFPISPLISLGSPWRRVRRPLRGAMALRPLGGQGAYLAIRAAISSAELPGMIRLRKPPSGPIRYMKAVWLIAVGSLLAEAMTCTR